MSEAPKTQEPATTQASPENNTAVAVEVDKSIPEPVAGLAAAHDQTTTTATPETPVATVEETAINKNKEKDNEKPEDLARSLLKGFQSRIAGVFPKKTDKITDTKDDKKDESTDVKDEKKDEDKDVKEIVKETKDRRSASRKRNSIFGGFGLGKKEEKQTSEDNPSADTGKETSSEPFQTVDPTPEPATASDASPEIPIERPGPSKRASIFGTLKSQFAKKDKTENLASVSKESEAINASAPVIPAVGSSDPSSNETVKSENNIEKFEKATDKGLDTTTSAEAKAEKLGVKSEKRKTSLHFGLGLGKKEKTHASDDENTEKPLSPFAKFRATVKSKTSPRASAEKKEEQVAPITEVKSEEPVTTQEIVSEPEPAVSNPTPAVAASA